MAHREVYERTTIDLPTYISSLRKADRGGIATPLNIGRWPAEPDYTLYTPLSLVFTPGGVTPKAKLIMVF